MRIRTGSHSLKELPHSIRIKSGHFPLPHARAPVRRAHLVRAVTASRELFTRSLSSLPAPPPRARRLAGWHIHWHEKDRLRSVEEDVVGVGRGGVALCLRPHGAQKEDEITRERREEAGNGAVPER